MKTDKPIRLGILVNSKYVRGWEYSIITDLLENRAFSVVSVFENASVSSSPFRWKKLCWRVLNKIEGAVSKRLFGAVWRTTKYYPDNLYDLRERLPDAQWMALNPLTSKSGLYQQFAPDDLRAIKEQDLDVIIRFGFNILRGKILTAARYGVWSYHHADNRINRGGPPGFWEFYRNQDTISATLQRLTQDLDGGQVIARGRYPTFRFSWNENRRRLVWRARFLITDALTRLARDREGFQLEEKDHRPLALYSERLFRAPGSIQSCLAFLKVAGRVGATLIERKVKRNQWRLLYAPEGAHGACLRKFTEIDPGSEKFWADPFIVRSQDKDWVFFEEYPYATAKAHISCGAIENGTLVDVRTVLDKPYHLSYPFVFEHQEALWMIPEAYNSGAVDLYRCEDFPGQWIKHKSLIKDVSAADTTLVKVGDIWWMFTNIDRSGIGDHSCELHLFFSDDPIDGEWIPHQANPVVQDCEYARMGGAFFEDKNGRLIRCGQKRGINYGEALRLFHVIKLSGSDYQEELLETIEPEWRDNAVGFHHCHLKGERAIFDVCVRTWKSPFGR